MLRDQVGIGVFIGLRFRVSDSRFWVWYRNISSQGVFCATLRVDRSGSLVHRTTTLNVGFRQL